MGALLDEALARYDAQPDINTPEGIADAMDTKLPADFRGKKAAAPAPAASKTPLLDDALARHDSEQASPPPAPDVAPDGSAPVMKGGIENAELRSPPGAREQLGNWWEHEKDTAKKLGSDVGKMFEPDPDAEDRSFLENVGEGAKRAFAPVADVAELAGAPGDAVRAVGEGTGHPVAGALAGEATNLALPLLGEVGKAGGAREAADILQTGVGRAARASKRAATAGYDARDAAALRADLHFTHDAPEIVALKQKAAENAPYMTGPARKAADKILALGESEAPAVPASKVLGPDGKPALPAQDASIMPRKVTHKELDDIRRTLQPALTGQTDSAALARELHQHATNAMTAMEEAAPDVRKMSSRLTEDYADETSPLQKLKKQIVGKTARPVDRKTAKQVFSAIKDPEVYDQAVATLNPDQRRAFDTLTTQMKRAQKLQAAGSKAARGAVAIEGGRLVLRGKGDDEVHVLGAAGVTALGLALVNPKVAMIVARGLGSPTVRATAAAAAIREVRRIGLLDDDTEETE